MRQSRYPGASNHTIPSTPADWAPAKSSGILAAFPAAGATAVSVIRIGSRVKRRTTEMVLPNRVVKLSAG